MIVAGFGLRGKATTASLQAALDLTATRVTDIAVVTDKAGLAAVRGLVAVTGLPLHPVALPDLSPDAPTLSPHQPARYGKGSVAEAAALAVAGKGAKLIQTRLTSPDGMATVAIAEGSGL